MKKTELEEEKLMKPKLIWKGTIEEAIKEGKITQKDVDDWHMQDEEGEKYTEGYNKGRKQALEEVEKIIEKVDKENGWEENPVTKHRAILVLTLQERMKKQLGENK